MRLTTTRIMEIASKYIDDYAVVAIRTQDHPFELGPVEHKSSVWDDGEMTDDILSGISGTNISTPYVRRHASDFKPWDGFYVGKHQAIIVGNSFEYGEDAGEVIIRDAVVIEIIS